MYLKGANLRVAVVLGVQVGRHFGALWCRAAALTSSQLSPLLHCLRRLSSVYRNRTLLGFARRRVRTAHDSELRMGRPSAGGGERHHPIPFLRRGISLNFAPLATAAPQNIYYKVSIQLIIRQWKLCSLLIIN
jgi:hypothetical protein